MNTVTEKDLKTACDAIMRSDDQELHEMAESDLEKSYFFRWKEGAPTEWNAYQFHNLLKLYGSRCRRWEEHHHGSCCVVERVRDKYLMPKIRAFLAALELHRPNIHGQPRPPEKL